jgi:hypothetical protein
VIETRINQVLDMLVARTAALAACRRPDDTISTEGLITIWDGPEWRSYDDHIQGAHVVIGYGGDDPEALTPAAVTALKAGPMAGAVRPRDEEGTITCRAVFDRADSAKLARDGALAALVMVADLCRSDPSLTIDASATVGGVVVRCWVTAGTLLQYLQAGYTAEYEFTVTFKTRV